MILTVSRCSWLARTLASIRQHPDWYLQGETSHVA